MNFFEASPTGKSSKMSRLSGGYRGSALSSPTTSKHKRRLGPYGTQGVISLQGSVVLDRDQQSIAFRREAAPTKGNLTAGGLMDDATTPRVRGRIQSTNLTGMYQLPQDTQPIPELIESMTSREKSPRDKGSPNRGPPKMKLFQKLRTPTLGQLVEHEDKSQNGVTANTTLGPPRPLATQESIQIPIPRTDYRKVSQSRAETLFDNPRFTETQQRQVSLMPTSQSGWEGTSGQVRTTTSGMLSIRIGTKSLRQLEMVSLGASQTIELDQQHHGHGSEESARESSKKRSQPKVEKNLPLRLDTQVDLVFELTQNKCFTDYLSTRGLEIRPKQAAENQQTMTVNSSQALPQGTNIFHQYTTNSASELQESVNPMVRVEKHTTRESGFSWSAMKTQMMATTADKSRSDALQAEAVTRSVPTSLTFNNLLAKSTLDLRSKSLATKTRTGQSPKIAVRLRLRSADKMPAKKSAVLANDHSTRQPQLHISFAHQKKFNSEN